MGDYMWYTPDGDPSYALEGWWDDVSELYEDERKDYWTKKLRDSNLGPEAIDEADAFASKWLDALYGLGRVDNEQLLQAWVDPVRRKMILESLYMQNTLRTLSAGPSNERLSEILMLTLGGSTGKHALTERTLRFLQHAGRCYMHRLDPVCVIFCRSVLDAAFDGQISRDACMDVLGSRDPAHFSLSERIKVAKRKAIISKETAKMAYEVKKAGDACIHQSPHTNVEPFAIVKKTLMVLCELGEKPAR